jgi:hypothetical protein
MQRPQMENPNEKMENSEFLISAYAAAIDDDCGCVIQRVPFLILFVLSTDLMRNGV